MPDVNSKSPQELIEALIDLGLTQTEISEITKVSQPTIARIKKGDHKDPRSSTVDALRALYEAKTKAA